MRRAAFLGVVLTLALVMAACAPATATEAPTLSVPVTGNDTATPEVMTTATSEATSTAASNSTTESPTVEATTDSSTGSTDTPTDAAVRIGTSTSTGVNEPFLVDQTGRVVYLFTEDTQNGGDSACTDDCETEWQPVIVTGTPSAGSGINTGLLGTITRDDGPMQATYNGWPLYYYVGDTVAGDMNGQGMAGSWFLVSATGNAIQQ